MVADDELMDVGAQAERTGLAWQRTMFSMIAVGALLLHAHINERLWPMWPGALLMTLAGGTALVVVPLHYRWILRTVRSGHSPVSRTTISVTTLALVVTIVGVCAELLLI